ncbi:hypothetical protein BDN70DRAFT_900848 [Pholiota conissans]|uniref:Uncharacterized protein n=1 Tax=Pholiota conissans TaxID=109636 RepID=A0A9P5YMJ1_9AGAR|nr:hypothetical protein BDN70DRAFT_900848 [Pholiota conissans]
MPPKISPLLTKRKNKPHRRVIKESDVEAAHIVTVRKVNVTKRNGQIVQERQKFPLFGPYAFSNTEVTSNDERSFIPAVNHTNNEVTDSGGDWYADRDDAGPSVNGSSTDQPPADKSSTPKTQKDYILQHYSAERLCQPKCPLVQRATLVHWPYGSAKTASLQVLDAGNVCVMPTKKALYIEFNDGPAALFVNIIYGIPCTA